MSSNEESREQGPLGFLPFLTQPSGEYGYPQGPGFAPVPLADGPRQEPPPPGPPPLGPPPLGPLPERGPSVPPFPGLDREPFLETADSLTTEFLLHGKRPTPGSGWRRVVYLATGGLFRVGESAADMHRRDLVNRVKTPVAGGHYRVAVLSLKGGVGKTTTVAGLGATLATFRGDRVIAVDANPDRGTLSDKVRLETAATIRDLLNERAQVRRYADVRAFTSQAPSRLEVLASDRDPGVTMAFSAQDYCAAAQVLENFYSICITDCGTGLLHSAMSGVLRLTDQIVLVSSPSVDGARSASATLDWLDAHECGELVRNAVVVLSAIRPRSKSTIDLDRLEQHFAARCRAVVRIPYDSHLEEGAEVELELMSAGTAGAYLELAAIVGDGFAWPHRLISRSG
jgi:MinD-like ATPase involved in chromosome partitioning or flagellar assembly